MILLILQNGLKNAPMYIKRIHNAKDIPEAVRAFYQAVENNTPTVAMESERNMYANQAYALFGGDKVEGDENRLLSASLISTAMTNSATATKLNDVNCGKKSGEVDGNIVNVAKSLLGYFSYENLHGTKYVSNRDDIKTLSDVKKDGVTDCSGFVWLVLKLAGYKVPANMEWYTGAPPPRRRYREAGVIPAQCRCCVSEVFSKDVTGRSLPGRLEDAFDA